MPVPVPNLAYVPIGFGVPHGPTARDGAKSVSTGPLVWPNIQGYLIDLAQNLQLQEVQNLQSVWVDNTAYTAAVSIVISGTNQLIKIPAGAQAWLPVFATERSLITVTVVSPATAGSTSLLFLNIPCSTYVFVPGV